MKRNKYDKERTRGEAEAIESLIGHMEQQHTGRDLSQEMDRLFKDRDCPAASSFPDARTRNRLVRAAIEQNREKIERWAEDTRDACDASGKPLTLSINTTFEDMSVIGIVSDQRTHRISARVTDTICLVLGATEHGLFTLVNAYPQMTAPYGKPCSIAMSDVLRHTQAYQEADILGKATLEEMCRMGDWAVIRASRTRDTTEIEIREVDGSFGTVTIHPDKCVWRCEEGDDAEVLCTRKGSNVMQRRAFPKTARRIEKLWQRAEDIEGDASPCVSATEAYAEETINETQATPPAKQRMTKKERARRKAQIRSAKAQKRKQKKKKTKHPRNKEPKTSNKTASRMQTEEDVLDENMGLDKITCGSHSLTWNQ
jgi:hypothetical protein